MEAGSESSLKILKRSSVACENGAYVVEAMFHITRCLTEHGKLGRLINVNCIFLCVSM